MDDINDTGLSSAALSADNQVYWYVTVDSFSDIVQYSSVVCIQCFLVLLQHVMAMLCCLSTAQP